MKITPANSSGCVFPGNSPEMQNFAHYPICHILRFNTLKAAAPGSSVCRGLSEILPRASYRENIPSELAHPLALSIRDASPSTFVSPVRLSAAKLSQRWLARAPGTRSPLSLPPNSAYTLQLRRHATTRTNWRNYVTNNRIDGI